MAEGDQQALGLLYDRTSPLIHGLLRRMLANPSEAEEALLDVYMRAWKNARGYSSARAGVQAWLSMMARSIAIDRIRHRRAQPTITEADLTALWEFNSPLATPETESMDAELRGRVTTALAELPEQTRNILLLAFFSGYTHSELAERLGEPLGTIKSRIRTALLRLREILEKEGLGSEILS
jgi:RNA polymerase sigma-70 factor (ECF subfamily)